MANWLHINIVVVNDSWMCWLLWLNGTVGVNVLLYCDWLLSTRKSWCIPQHHAHPAAVHRWIGKLWQNDHSCELNGNDNDDFLQCVCTAVQNAAVLCQFLSLFIVRRCVHSLRSLLLCAFKIITRFHSYCFYFC